MKQKILVLGAGFGGLELCTILSDKFGDAIDVTLIDRNDSFHFGWTKFDVMFGHTEPANIKHYYKDFVKPGITFRQENITVIDPAAKRVTTDSGTYNADVIVIALGADYDQAATPGLLEGGDEFYSVKGATRLRDKLPAFTRGNIIVGVTAVPFKCPPGPSEAAMLTHEYLVKRGIREQAKISLVMPYERPIPPSPETSKALMDAFKERNIEFVTLRVVSAIDPARKVAILDNGDEMPFDLFLGIPKHVVPKPVADSGLTVNGWVAVDQKTLMTSHQDVYAIGDVMNIGIPKAGTFAESAAGIVAEQIIMKIEESNEVGAYRGNGTCYIEFGGGLAGKVNIDFFSGAAPSIIFNQPEADNWADKQAYGKRQVARWFGK